MEILRKKNLLTIMVEGDFDLSVCPQIKAAINEEMSSNKITRIIFDMENCNFIDSSGLGVILLCYKNTAPLGGSVSVRNVRPELVRLFTMAGLDRIISVSPLKEVYNG